MRRRQGVDGWGQPWNHGGGWGSGLSSRWNRWACGDDYMEAKVGRGWGSGGGHDTLFSSATDRRVGKHYDSGEGR